MPRPRAPRPETAAPLLVRARSPGRTHPRCPSQQTSASQTPTSVVADSRTLPPGPDARAPRTWDPDLPPTGASPHRLRGVSLPVANRLSTHIPNLGVLTDVPFA